MLIVKVLDALAREPVLLGAAILATIQVWDPSPAVMVAAGAWVALVQRAASKSKRTADEEADGAKWIGAVEERSRHPLT